MTEAIKSGLSEKSEEMATKEAGNLKQIILHWSKTNKMSYVISAKWYKNLRDATGAGMMDCKAT